MSIDYSIQVITQQTINQEWRLVLIKRYLGPVAQNLRIKRKSQKSNVSQKIKRKSNKSNVTLRSIFFSVAQKVMFDIKREYQT